MDVSAKRRAYAALTAAFVFLSPALALAANSTYSLGVEGFYDNYKEPDATVDNKAEYGSLTGNYAYNWTSFFAALDGRVSYGRDKYSSEDGTSSGIPQWEFELRPRVGFSFTGAGGAFSPYIGAGARYYRDEFKGVTSMADGITYGGYDRNIIQFYMPVGITYEHTTDAGWTISPNIEYDQFLWGQVSSRLGTLGNGYFNVLNDQDSGWGARGSVMFGKAENGWGWQIGPFVRYWDIASSDSSVAGVQYDPQTRQNEPLVGEEPHNTRLQAGLAARIVW